MTKQTKTVSIKGYVTHQSCAHGGDALISFSAFKPHAEYQPRTVVINELTIEVQVPVNFDPRTSLIENLRAQQTKAAADFQTLTTSILRQISELQALEMTV